MPSRKLRVGVSLLCVLLLGVFTQTGFPQSADGNLVGTVFDSTGAAIPGATVELENLATGIKSTTKADAAGFYRFANLLVGRYSVKASANGFTPATVNQIPIELSKTATVNLTLAVAGVAVEIRVTEAPALIDTTTPHISNTYTSQVIADLPLAANPAGGGIHNVSLLGAGVG